MERLDQSGAGRLNERMRCGRCDLQCARSSNHQLYCGQCSREMKIIRDRSRQHPVAAKSCKKCDQSIPGRQTYCQPCSRAARRERDRVLQQARRQSPEAKEKSRLRAQQRNPLRKDYQREYQRNRNATDPQWTVNRRMKAMISNALRGEKNGRSWPALVGYTVGDLMRHLERQFLPGMTWENRGRWQIDHIRPASSFLFESSSDPQFRECWALTNLRPLWSPDNRKKWDQRIYLV